MRTKRALCVPGNSGGTFSRKIPIEIRDASADSSTALRRGRSSLLQTPEASPVLERKTVPSKFGTLKLKENSNENLNLFSESESPVLRQKKLPLNANVVFNVASVKLPSNAEDCENVKKRQLRKRQILHLVHPSPLSDRKNIMSGNTNQEDGKKSSNNRHIIEMTSLDKENQNELPIRKSVRTKKVTGKFKAYMDNFTSATNPVQKLPSQSDTKQSKRKYLESTENIALDVGGKRNVKNRKLCEKSASVASDPESSWYNDESDKDTYVLGSSSMCKLKINADGNSLKHLRKNKNSKNSEVKEVNQIKSGKKIVSRSYAVERRKRAKFVRVSHEESLGNYIGKENEDTPSLGVLSGPSEVKDSNFKRLTRTRGNTLKRSNTLLSSLPPKKENMAVAVSSAKVSLRRTSSSARSNSKPSVMSGRVISKKSSPVQKKNMKTFASAVGKVLTNSIEKSPKTPVVSTKKKSKTNSVKTKLNLKASLTPTTRNTRATDPSAKKSSKPTVTLAKKNEKHLTSSVRKSLKPTTLKDRSFSELTKADKSDLSRKAINLQIDSKLTVRMPPIWASERNGAKCPKPGARRSIRGKSNVFDFSPSPVKDDNKKRKRQKKPKVRAKVTKPKPGYKTTLLITNLDWQNPIDITSCVRALESASQVSGGESMRSTTSEGNVTGAQSTRSATFEYSVTGGQSVRSAVSDYGFDDDDIDTHEDVDAGECPKNDEICAKQNINVFEGIPGETSSSFVTLLQNAATSQPMLSASSMPTPAILKHFIKEFGSSTPRIENSLMTTVAKEPLSVKEDIAQHFGFEGSSDDAEANNTTFSISPVRQLGIQSHLNLSSASDMFDNTNQSFSKPYRFSWGSLQPGYHSSNLSRSTSMVVHGRNVNRSTSSSLSSGSPVALKNTKSSAKSKSCAKLASANAPSNKNPIAEQTNQGKRNSRAQANKPVKASQSSSMHDVSMLFDEELLEDVENCNNVAQTSKATVSLTTLGQFLSQTTASQSPEKVFGRPARKSYNKKSLEESRKKFIKECGGIATTEAETEEDASVNTETKKRKRTANRKRVTKKKLERTKPGSKTDLSQSTDDSTVVVSPDKRKPKAAKKKKKKENKFEASLQNWASDLNSHFSEIEDCELVVL